jgi:hypothetical protein
MRPGQRSAPVQHVADNDSDNPIQEPVITQVQLSLQCYNQPSFLLDFTNLKSFPFYFQARNMVHHKACRMKILGTQCGHKCLMR